MARQGHRVWLARLAILMASFLIVSALGQWWWVSVTKPNPDTKTTLAPDPSVEVPPNRSPSEPMASSSMKHNAAPKPSVHPLDDVLALARKALLQHQERHRDYTACLLKTERIGKSLSPTAKMRLKLRYGEMKPERRDREVSVYLRFLEPKAQAGREVLYSPSLNQGLMKAHEGGLLGLISVDLAPNSQLAMRGNRYPISEIGIERLITKLLEKGERDRNLGDCEVSRSEGVIVEDRICELIEVKHPDRFVELHGDRIEHEFHIARIWFDEEELVPVRYASYSWPLNGDTEPVLEEEYLYTDLEFNVGLKDSDFEPDNKEYRFP